MGDDFWMIISWQHVDRLDDGYGRLLATVLGEKEAIEEAHKWVKLGWESVGIVREVRND